HHRDLHSFPTRRSSDLDAQKKSDPAETEAKSLLARVKQLKQQLDQMPDKKIPELQFVTDKDWLIAVTKNPAETDTDSRKALVTLDRKSTRLNSSHDQIS